MHEIKSHRDLDVWKVSMDFVIETQMEIAQRLKYIKSIEQYKDTLDRIRKMLLGLIRRVTHHTSS
ncbi:MAG: hypothetical protein NTX61_11540 [Bacteroidetes bacterium]|nr:hypothetical protein [Bacteroidota bacterium]